MQWIFRLDPQVRQPETATQIKISGIEQQRFIGRESELVKRENREERDARNMQRHRARALWAMFLKPPPTLSLSLSPALSSFFSLIATPRLTAFLSPTAAIATVTSSFTAPLPPAHFLHSTTTALLSGKASSRIVIMPPQRCRSLAQCPPTATSIFATVAASSHVTTALFFIIGRNIWASLDRIGFWTSFGPNL